VGQADSALPSAALGGDTIDVGSVPPARGGYAPVAPAGHPADGWTDREEEPFDVLDQVDPAGGYPDPATGETDIDEDGARRHRLMVIGLPLLALIVVIALAWWVGSTLLNVTGSVDQVQGSTPSVSAPADGSANPSTPAGAPVAIASADVFDPGGDGQPENNSDVPLAYDGDAATAWSTVTYRGSPAFGNLKDGVGLRLDLGSSQALSGVTLTTTRPGATVEIRTSDAAGTDLDSFTPVADGTLKDSTDLAFGEPVNARYVLVWITRLVSAQDGFSADIAEITVHAAG
jgi:hypothetical protein